LQELLGNESSAWGLFVLGNERSWARKVPVPARVIMLHKIINNLVDIDTNQYLEPAVVRGEEVVRFIIPYARTSAYKYSFFPSAVRLWYNILAPMTFVSLSNLRLSLAITQLD